MLSRFLRVICLTSAVAFAIFATSPLIAQDSTKTAAKDAAADSPSRWDIFAGYSYLAPHGNVGGFPARAINVGAIGSVARYFNNYLGVQAEGDYHNDHNENQLNNDFAGVSGGIIFRYPTTDITPFVHALVGAENAGGTYYDNKWGTVLTIGGGLDYETPWLNHRLAIRLFQADYQYSHINFFPLGRANFDMARLSAGVVFHVGTIAPPPPVTIACSANPTSVFAGDPVTLAATASGFNPKDHAIYSWTGNGVTGSDTTAKVDTSTLAPGTYTVSCGIKTGKPGKEGLKPWQVANGSATFTVKEFEPPTISCSANPTSIQQGESATVTATAASPQNRPLTYNYSATAGTINGTGSTAKFDSTGAPVGTTQVTCNVADDKGHSANSTANVTIVAPPPPPGPSPEQVRLEARLALHSVFFPTAQPNPQHPDRGLVESQQATLRTLAADFKNYLAIKPDARLTLTGHADVRGSAEYNQALTERRVNRAKAFLVEQGVPESSIDTRAVGKEHQLSGDEVKALLAKNTELTDAERKKILSQLNVIVLAQNRRVDVTLSTTGQQSVREFPFNASDALTLLGTKSPAPKKKAAPKR